MTYIEIIFFPFAVFTVAFFSSVNSFVCIFWFMVFFVEEAKFFQPWSSIISNGRKLRFMIPLSSQQIWKTVRLGLSSVRLGLSHNCDFCDAIFLINVFNK